MVEITKPKKKIADEFEIKDLGNLKCFLGMEVEKTSERFDMLKETCITGCRLTDTFIEFNARLRDYVGKVHIGKERYEGLVGYLSHTRPYISYLLMLLVNLCKHSTKNLGSYELNSEIFEKYSR